VNAPFPYFGGKRSVVADVWQRFGEPKQYIEPFAGSLAIMLGKPTGPASLEVIGDANGFIANFWRAVKHQPAEVAHAADYPVSHIDQGARHTWMMTQRDRLAVELHDPFWPGDATVAGWWLWGQCSWIGSGWCDWFKVSDAGRGVQAVGQVPQVGNAGMGVQAAGKVPQVSDAGMLTSSGEVAWVWLHKLAERLERVRVIHGHWDRCLNHHYGAEKTAVFLDPPYLAFEGLYGSKAPVAKECEAWAREHPHLRVALCGHLGDYELPGWEAMQWSRDGSTYGSTKTKDAECIWFSPACAKIAARPVQAAFL
jgi:DNA adenine methylase